MWKDFYAQVNCYRGALFKKYNTEAEALRAYYGANHGHQPTMEIEEKLAAEDMNIRRLAFWSWKDVMLLFMAMVIAFLIWKLM
jgi:hypothetical protein